MTSKVAVVTDSALPPCLPRSAQLWGIRVVPLQVIVDGVSFAEGSEISSGQVLAALVAGVAAGLLQPACAKSTEFILANMSQRMAAQLKEEMEALGKVREKDGEEAMSAIVAAIRELEASGEILLVAGEE